MYELRLQRKGGTVYTHRVGVMPVQVGRAPNNDLVLADPMVSQQHASIYVHDGRLMVRDLASRNGTFVDGERVAGVAEVADGASIRIGPDTVLRVVRVGDAVPIVAQGFVIEDLRTGVCAAVASDRVYVGSGPDADLVLPDAPARLATIIVHDNGEIWLGTDEGDQPVELGAPFEVEGRGFVLRAGDSLRAPTAQPRADRYPYSIRATLQGATGPEAIVRDVNSGHTYRVEAENRAILLYLLARQVNQDREEGLAASAVGWCTDDDIRVGVWGRGTGEDNKLHVLVYRLRNELKKAGFDPWFIEKRRKYIRARVLGAEIG